MFTSEWLKVAKGCKGWLGGLDLNPGFEIIELEGLDILQTQYSNRKGRNTIKTAFMIQILRGELWALDI